MGDSTSKVLLCVDLLLSGAVSSLAFLLWVNRIARHWITGLESFGVRCRDSCELWQHNVRSIALSLQALRAVDRYGVTRRSEQYKGWAKLPSPEAAADPIKDAKQRLAKIVGHAWDPEDLRRMVRMAKSRTHPDAGGSVADFQAVCQAEETLNQQACDAER